MLITHEVRLFRTEVPLTTGARFTLVSEVLIGKDGQCRLYFSHTGRNGPDDHPWFSDSLSFADSLDEAMQNIESLACHIASCSEAVV